MGPLPSYGLKCLVLGRDPANSIHCRRKQSAVWECTWGVWPFRQTHLCMNYMYIMAGSEQVLGRGVKPEAMLC